MKLWCSVQFRAYLGTVALNFGVALSASAGPWAAPGELTLRHDLQLLADRGVIRAPLMTWPISWGDLVAELSTENLPATTLSRGEVAALTRVRQRFALASEADRVNLHLRAASAERPRQLRTFEATPRESAEVEAGLDWLGDRLAVSVQVTGVDNPDDGKNVRLDGSYAGIALGNYMLSLGLTDKWWGPGWDGSLILSNNARPIPALGFQRNNSDRFKPKWLRWLGPWTLTVLVGQMEGSRPVPDPFFLGARVNFKPVAALDLAISRTAQWGGDGRPQTLDSLIDLFVGRDNVGEDGLTRETEPGNQLAGFDGRWAFQRLPVGLAVYGQMIGEDGAGRLPSRYLGLFGVESSGTWRSSGASYRIGVEYSDTTCDFKDSDPIFDCAYNNSIYRAGYRYRGRVIGHSTDNDTQMFSVRGLLVDSAGRSWNVLLRRADLNRGGVTGATNTVTTAAQQLVNMELTHTRQTRFGLLEIGLGFDRIEDSLSGKTGNDGRAYLQWRAEF